MVLKERKKKVQYIETTHNACLDLGQKNRLEIYQKKKKNRQTIEYCCNGDILNEQLNLNYLQ